MTRPTRSRARLAAATLPCLALVLLAPALLGPAIVALSVYFAYRYSEALARLLGEVAMSVIVRLSSFILFCIGVQILWNGCKVLLATVLSH